MYKMPLAIPACRYSETGPTKRKPCKMVADSWLSVPGTDGSIFLCQVTRTIQKAAKQQGICVYVGSRSVACCWSPVAALMALGVSPAPRGGAAVGQRRNGGVTAVCGRHLPAERPRGPEPPPPPPSPQVERRPFGFRARTLFWGEARGRAGLRWPRVLWEPRCQACAPSRGSEPPAPSAIHLWHIRECESWGDSIERGTNANAVQPRAPAGAGLRYCKI